MLKWGIGALGCDQQLMGTVSAPICIFELATGLGLVGQLRLERDSQLQQSGERLGKVLQPVSNVCYL